MKVIILLLMLIFVTYCVNITNISIKPGFDSSSKSDFFVEVVDDVTVYKEIFRNVTNLNATINFNSDLCLNDCFIIVMWRTNSQQPNPFGRYFFVNFIHDFKRSENHIVGISSFSYGFINKNTDNNLLYFDSYFLNYDNLEGSFVIRRSDYELS